MEKALWKNENIYASTVKESYEFEKLIREASSKGELRCPDTNCESPVLKYCHGNKKRPYFAHKYVSDCDYDKYDRYNSEIINNIKFLIFEHLTKNGFKADVDKKVFEHQYAHIAVFKDVGFLAVELVSDSVTSRKINRVSDQYKTNDIPVQFLVVGDYVLLENESDSNFIRRFSLNETFNNNLLVINENGAEIYQYRMDSFNYTYCGARLPDYESVYYEKSDFEELTFENGFLTISGFDDRYNNWYNQKQSRFKEFITSKITPILKPQESNCNKVEVSHINTVAPQKNVVSEIKTQVIDENKMIELSELHYLEFISLPEGGTLVKLFPWTEEDFLNRLRRVCYNSEESAFKQLIIKMAKPSSEEWGFIKSLGNKFKEEREDYYYILKTAYYKAKELF